LIAQIDQANSEGSKGAHSEIVYSRNIHALIVMQVLMGKQKGAGFPTPLPN
jgi:hypothetical protein